MATLLTRASLRYLLRHPWLFGLSVLGVALGVAVVVSIDLANESARRAFALSTETVTGRATHQVVGAARGLDEAVYTRLRVEGRVRPIAPVVEGYAAVPSAPGRTLHLLGVDVFAEGPFRPYLDEEARFDTDLSALLTEPGTALLSAETARLLGRAAGDTLRLRIEGVTKPVRLAGLLEAGDERSRRALENLLVTDVSTAQELLGATGRLSRIDLILEEGPEGERARRRIEAMLPAGAALERTAARTETVGQMTAAFNLNLTALSLLALIVGMFLIYNTMTFSVVQRRTLIGIERALGVTRGQVFRLVLAEALVIGLLGTAAGLAAGIVLGRELVELVTRTINDLYFVLEVRGLALPPLALLKGAALGLGATLLAAVAPAHEATTAPPSVALRRSTSESRIRRLLPRLSLLGALLLGLGGGLLLLPTRSIGIAYAALLAVLLGFALFAPAVTMGLAGAARPVMGRLMGLLGRMSARGVVANLSRTSVAIAALAVAVASTIGVGVMVDSFRRTVVQWLETSLQADVYVSPPSLVFRRNAGTMDEALARRLLATPGVGGFTTIRNVSVETPGGAADLHVVRLTPRAHGAFRFRQGGGANLWRRFEAGEEVVAVSEPYAYRRGLRAGSVIRLRTDRGVRDFRVDGVYYDYGSDLGTVLMGRATYERFYADRGLSGLGLFAAPGVEVDALVERLRERVPAGRELFIRSNRALRESSLEVFDRTFTITSVLRLLAIVVAFIGVLTALMALQLERARELAVLRANGLTPGQVYGLVTAQTGLMGFIAGLLAAPVGLVLALVLVYVINRRSFGWTLQLTVSPSVLAEALLLALVAAVLAGLYPSWKMAQANPAEALREE